MNAMRVADQSHRIPMRHGRGNHNGERLRRSHGDKSRYNDFERMRMKAPQRSQIIKDDFDGVGSHNLQGVPTITFCNTTSTPLIINRFVTCVLLCRYA